MAKGGEENKGDADKTTKRSRWATRKLTVKSSGLKRISIIDRIHKRTNSTEKKRQSAGSNSLRQDGDNESAYDPNTQDDANSTTSSSDGESRMLFFNQPLPDQFKDEEGHPRQQFTRNKIRTAKYTPLSFIPKNLWFQFHNVANIFFLFLVILVVSQQNKTVRRVCITRQSSCLALPYISPAVSPAQRLDAANLAIDISHFWRHKSRA
jgi:phospholipid-translocating ATPase